MALENPDVPYSPAWWFNMLACQLQDRRYGRMGGRRWSRTGRKPGMVRPGLDLLDSHLRGDPPLMNCAEGWKDGFREVTRLGRLNVAALVVEAKANRMVLRDFRTAAANDELGDEQARRIMRKNNLGVRSRDVHYKMLGLRDGYAMVTPKGEGEIPIVTAEDPRECITYEDPATGETVAALKLYRDAWMNADYGHLFIREDDGSVSHHKATLGGLSTLNAKRFMLSTAWGWDGDPEYVPADQMPIIRFSNRDGVSEFELHLDTLDRINDQILDKMVIAKLQAFRQRAIKGLPDTERVFEDGKIVEKKIDYTDAFLAGPGELWQLPEGAEFWESAVTDMTPLLNSIKHDLIHFAAVTSTPLNFVTPDAAAGSAEGASLMREAHVYAVEACMTHAERAWAQVMATCFAFMGDEKRSDVTQIEPIWGPTERYSLAEKGVAAAQAGTSLPREAIQRDIWQYPPAEIPNLRMLSGRDFLMQGGTPAPPANPAPVASQPAIPGLEQLGAPGGADTAATG